MTEYGVSLIKSDIHEIVRKYPWAENGRQYAAFFIACVREGSHLLPDEANAAFAASRRYWENGNATEAELNDFEAMCRNHWTCDNSFEDRVYRLISFTLGREKAGDGCEYVGWFFDIFEMAGFPAEILDRNAAHFFPPE